MIDTSTVTSAILALPPRHQVPTSEDRAAAWGGGCGTVFGLLVAVAVIWFVLSILRKILRKD